MFHEEKLRWKNEEKKKQQEIEDRLRTTTGSKDELEVIEFILSLLILCPSL